jgi:hypothetical protein
MTMNLLRQSASSRLPVPSYRTVDIDQVRILRAAGLVVALIPAPSNLLTLSGDGLAAQVLAVTQKGREELARFDYPEAWPPLWQKRMPRIFTKHRWPPRLPSKPAVPPGCTRPAVVNKPRRARLDTLVFKSLSGIALVART